MSTSWKKVKCIVPKCGSAKMDILTVKEDGITFKCKDCGTAFHRKCDTKGAKPTKKPKRKAKGKPKAKKKTTKRKATSKPKTPAKPKESEKKPIKAYEIEYPEGFTDKQRRFCEQYIIDCNATRAAKAAGYEEASAYNTGYDNLRKPDVRKVLEQMFEQDAQGAQITKQEIVGHLVEILQASPAHFQQMGADGVWTDNIDANHPLAGTLKKIKSVTKYDPEGNMAKIVSEIEIHDKLKAAQMLAQLLGYLDQQQATGTINVYTNVPEPKPPEKG